MDDDYVPSKYFLNRVVELFGRHTDIVGATGLVLADGVSRGSIGLLEARMIIGKHDRHDPEDNFEVIDVRHAYGCNMVFRAAAIANIRFDEDLPPYSWQEDVDFAARTLSKCRLVKTNDFLGVHRELLAQGPLVSVLDIQKYITHHIYKK